MSATITFNATTIRSSRDTTLLDALEANQLPIESHCRDGFCGACRCKLEAGEVKYVKSTLAYLDEGEVLACSTVPLSDVTLST